MFPAWPLRVFERHGDVPGIRPHDQDEEGFSSQNVESRFEKETQAQEWTTKKVVERKGSRIDLRQKSPNLSGAIRVSIRVSQVHSTSKVVNRCLQRLFARPRRTCARRQ